MTAKTPIRTVFDGSNNATGLAEFQSGEFIGLTHGGLGASLSIGTAGQVLKVNSGATALEFGNAVAVVDIDGATDLTGATLVAGDQILISDGGTEGRVTLSQIDTLFTSTTQTLTNKTIDTANNTITIVEADISDLGSYITASSTDTLTNKTIDTANNTITIDGTEATLSNIGNSSLTNSSITVTDGTTSTATSLGGTITFSGTANEVEVGESSGTITIGLPNDVTIGNDLIVSGNLTVNGTTTTVNSTTLTVDDKNIELGSTASPTDTSADGGGITLKGTTDKTFNWVDSTDSWTSSEHLDLATGKEFKINSSTVLTSSQVLGKSLPSGDVIGSSDTQTLTNKTINSASNTITITESNISDLQSYITASSTDTLTNKTISGASNTLSNIGNSSLSNSSITVAGDSGSDGVSLGETLTIAGGTGLTSTGSSNTITIALDNTTVTSGSYGSSTAIPTFTVDAQGRLTAASTTAISSDMSIAGDTGTDTITVGTDTFTIAGGTGLTSTATTDTITLNIDSTVVTLTDTQTLINKRLTSPDINAGTIDGATINGGTIGASTAVTELQVDNININGNSITSTNTNGNLSLSPDGSGTIDVNSAKITSLGTPTVGTDAATKAYVDTIAAAGIHYHDPVRVESPTNLNATYDNGTAGVGATLTNAGTQVALSIDGVTLSLSDRVLIYAQTNAAHNGIYYVSDTGSGASNWELTRTTDTDSYGASDPDAFGQGDAFFVKEGDTGAGELYVMNTEGTITFGTTNITFTQVAETAVYSAGAAGALTLTGTAFSANVDDSTIEISSNALQVKDSGITASQLATNSVTTTKITDANVTAAKLAATLDLSGKTITLPSSFTTNTDSQTLTNKTINTASNTITIVEADISDLQSYILADSTNTLTNKTISGSSNTLSNIGNSSLTNSTITVAGDSGSNAVDLGDTLTVSGTANEIQTSVSGDTITIGLPDNVTVGGALTVTGNLTVNGTTTTVNSTNTTLDDNLLELNSGAASNANDAGIIIERGSTGDNAIIAWDESADKFIVGTTTATASSTGNLTIATGTLVADIEGDVTGALTGNADTATALATGRTISLTGDVTGTSGSFDGSGNVSISATIAANSVALGTDTTGNYVATITAGTGISGSSSTEGGTPTIALSHLGLESLTDPNADRIFFWDDSAGSSAFLTVGSNLTLSGTTLSADTQAPVAGTAIDVSGTTVNLDLSELTTSTSDGDGDFFVVVDSANAQKKLTKANINISGFNNDAGYITSGGTSWQTVKTANFTASSGEGYFVNTTSVAITVTLPASPSLGDEITIIDYAGTADTNNITVARNGKNIQGSASDLTIAIERAAFTLVYVDTTQGWLLKDK